MRAVALFEEMTASGIEPDVVSCTALINALASCGEADKAEAVVKWMLSNGLSPNVCLIAEHALLWKLSPISLICFSLRSVPSLLYWPRLAMPRSSIEL